MFLQSALVDKLRVLVDDMPPSSSPFMPSSSDSIEDGERVMESPESPLPTTQRPDIEPSPTLRPLPVRRKIRHPKKGSLRAILRQHSGTALFLRPVGWTDLHVNLLGVRFCELPICDTPRPCALPGSPPTQRHMRPSNTITKLSKALSDILQPSSSLAVPKTTLETISFILMTLWPETFAKSDSITELNLYYGDKVYLNAVKVQALWNFPPNTSAPSSQSSIATIATRLAESFESSSSLDPTPHSTANLPMLCYIGKNQLANFRHNCLRVAMGPDNKPNIPVQRLHQIRRRRLFPADDDLDPHFVPIFLAMAQRHFYNAPVQPFGREAFWHPRKGEPCRPDFQDVKPRILTVDTNTNQFLVYTGHVTAKFLDRFYDPSSAPCDQDGNVMGMKIEFARVPIWPLMGLRERLGKAFGDIVGSFDPEHMETWEDDNPPSQPKPAESDVGRDDNVKRKRGAPPTIETLEEESDEDETGVADKKRCLDATGNRVGVVV